MALCYYFTFTLCATFFRAKLCAANNSFDYLAHANALSELLSSHGLAVIGIGVSGTNSSGQTHAHGQWLFPWGCGLIGYECEKMWIKKGS